MHDNQRFQEIEFVDVIFIVCRELEERTSSQPVSLSFRRLPGRLFSNLYVTADMCFLDITTPLYITFSL